MSLLPDRLLEVRSLSKSFRGRPVLTDVSFGVDAGSVVAVTGSNGSGKSTLLRCLAGLSGCSGDIRLDGRLIAAAAGRGDVAYLPQHTDLPEWATGAELLDLFGRLRGAGATPEAVPPGFLPDLNVRVGTLSGGQRRRVALAGVLAGNPPLLLLDEPAANLDEAGTAGLWHLLGALRERGSAVLVATPSPDEFDGLADRLLLLGDGGLTDDRPLRRSGAGLVVETVA